MAGDKSVTFSPREMEVLALSWQCMDAQPKIDMNKLALLTGYTPGSASVTFGKIKQKLKALGDSLSACPPAPITPKKAGGPGGRAKKTPTSTTKTAGKRGAGGAHAGETPSKRAKKGGSVGVGGMRGSGSAGEDGDADGDLPENVYVKREKMEEEDEGGEGDASVSFYEELRGGAFGE